MSRQERPDKSRAAAQRLAVILAALLLAGGVAACGKKGEPLTPDPGKSTYPQTYPKSW